MRHDLASGTPQSGPDLHPVLGFGVGMMVASPLLASLAVAATHAVHLPFLTVVSWFPAVFVGTLAHEAGHVLAGVVFGLRVEYVALGRLRFRPYACKKRFELAAEPAPALAHVFMVGRGPRSTLFPIAAMIAGGPMANLLMGIHLVQRAAGLDLVHDLCILTVGLTWISLGLSSLLPFRSRGMPTDGKQLLLLLTRRA